MAVHIEKSGPVTTVILDRPERRNAVDRPTAQALADAFRAFDADAAAKVAVLWGAGGHFCAGADLQAFASGQGNSLDPVESGAARPADGPMGPSRMLLGKPVIAAVSGYAVAGGLELACWCDLRVAEESAVFGVFCRRFGVPLIDGGTVRLPLLIGQARALDLIMTGRPVDSREALAIGLATRVVPDGQARAAAEGLARELSALPQTCLRSDRQSVYRAEGLALRDALAQEFQLGAATLASGESLAGARRFAEGKGRSGHGI